jgi:hypothetical protein
MGMVPAGDGGEAGRQRDLQAEALEERGVTGELAWLRQVSPAKIVHGHRFIFTHWHILRK